jgi:glyoxylate/hydroxypyruvate reductase
MTLLLAPTGLDPKPWQAALTALAPQRRVVTAADTDALADVRYALVWKPPAGLLARLPSLEVIVNLGAGVDAILADTTVPPTIPIIRSVDPNITGRMTEWVVLQVLTHFRQMPAYQAQQRERRWQDLPQKAASAATVGLMGVGVLGQHAATALRLLGFNVVGWSRMPKSVLGFPVHHGEAGLTDFLGATDILVCLLPLTPETTGILNYPLFQRLRRTGPLGGPVLINAGRGGEQVEGDILRALDDGTLLGATLDVFETEPLPLSSRLWQHPKVFITPHVAADSDPEAMTAYVLDQLARHEAGLPMATVVDRRAGY